MYFFTADEHYGHKNILKFCNRPFSTIEEMNNTLIFNHNNVVGKDDITIHAGDFSFYKRDITFNEIITYLNGNHIFLEGDHDKWMNSKQIWRKTIDGQHIVVCHYNMRVWPRSHYNSWQLYGHSHGKLEPVGKQWDIGVDNNNYYPVSLNQIKEIMKNRPDNFNLIKKGRK